MSKREEPETSLTRSADALSAFAHHTPGGVAADFIGLEKGTPMEVRLDNSPCQGQSPAAVELTVPPATSGEDRNMEICAWCGFMMHYGRGPISHGICPSCREVFFPEVPNA